MVAKVRSSRGRHRPQAQYNLTNGRYEDIEDEGDRGGEERGRRGTIVRVHAKRRSLGAKRPSPGSPLLPFYAVPSSIKSKRGRRLPVRLAESPKREAQKATTVANTWVCQ